MAIDVGTYFSPSQTVSSFGALVNAVVRTAFVLAGVLCFLLLLFGGVRVIFGAGGDAKKLEQGKEAIVGALVGLLLVVTSVWIVQILENITGVSLLSLPSL